MIYELNIHIKWAIYSGFRSKKKNDRIMELCTCANGKILLAKQLLFNISHVVLGL